MLALAPEELGLDRASLLPGSPDGRFIAMTSYDRRSQVLVVPLPGDHKPFAFPQSPGATADASFSPDAKWMAYSSDESGRPEIYVVPFPGQKGKWQISTNGGNRTWWVGHGENTELLYLDSQSRLVSVPVRTHGDQLTTGTAQVLLAGKSLANTGCIDITQDGKRIMLCQPQSNAGTALTLVLNWTAELRK